jgi:hypothetical protein
MKNYREIEKPRKNESMTSYLRIKNKSVIMCCTKMRKIFIKVKVKDKMCVDKFGLKASSRKNKQTKK